MFGRVRVSSLEIVLHLTRRRAAIGRNARMAKTASDARPTRRRLLRACNSEVAVSKRDKPLTAESAVPELLGESRPGPAHSARLVAESCEEIILSIHLETAANKFQCRV